jgi:hypothetical protein
MDLLRARALAWAGGIEAMRDMTRRSAGGVVHDEDGITLVAASHPMPFLINCVARIDAGLPAHDVMERAQSFFGERDRGFSLLALADTDEDLVAAAEAKGMVATGDPAPLMAIDEPTTDINLPSGVRVETATTADHVSDVIDVCSDGYAVYGMPPDVVPAVLSPPDVLLADHLATVIAYDAEGPVASAQALATHGTAYLQWVATKQRAFRQGAGRAVTEAATKAGFELGASVATLMASSMGAPLYRKLGWTDVGLCHTRVAFGPL